MLKIAVVRRELSLWKNVVLRLSIAMIGVVLISFITSISMKTDFIKILSTTISVFKSPDVLRYVQPLLPIALGLSVTYYAKLWNLGAEGQLVMGAIGATFIALFTPFGKMDIVGPCIGIAMSMAMGVLWALIPAILKIYLGVNEALTSLMLNYVAYYIANYLVYGPWKGRSVYGYPETDMIPDASRIPRVYGYSFSIYPIILSIITMAILWIFLYRTRIGIAIRALGSSSRALEISGISIKKIVLLTFIISGSLAGFAGGTEVLTYHRKLVPGEKIGAGMGYTAIMVSWFAQLNPLLIPLSSYYVGSLYVIRMSIQEGAAVGDAVARMFIGIIFILILITEFIAKYKLVVKI